MKFWKFHLLVLLLAGISFCSGCASDSQGFSEKDRLTKAETDAVISHVRKFVLQSRKLRLTSAEAEVIRTTEPQVGVRYTGPKSGRLSIHWSLPNYRTLLVQRSGDLLSNSRADWTTRVITGSTSDKLPENFFGAHGEDVSLPVE